MDIIQSSQKYNDYVIELRRFLHQIAEPGFEEVKTTDKIIEELQRFGIEHKRCSITGVIGEIKGKRTGKTVALRADIDALSIHEENDIPYKSINSGFMHACGHDTHNAMLLTAARILKEREDEIEGNVRLIFQPAEEGSKSGLIGAKYMIDEGALDGVNSIFGLHISPGLECGKIATAAGPIMASAAEFEITITGRSGHGAAPHQCADPIIAASSIAMNLQTLVSREIDPLEPVVISICTINGGTRFNVIPDEVKMTGTVRTFSYELSEEIQSMMERVINSTADSYRVKAKLMYRNSIRPTINDQYCSGLAEETIKKLYGDESFVILDKALGCEDFSEYASRIPAVFCLLGAGNEDKEDNYPAHNSKFRINENALPIGASLHAQYAIDYLKKIK